MKIIVASFANNGRKKYLIWFVLLLLFLLVMLMLKPESPTITKEEVLQAIYNTQQTQNYRWYIRTEITIKGVHNILSDVYGEKSGTAFHLAGNFVKSPLEIYQLSNLTYRLDPITNQWLVIKNNNLRNEEVLLTELNPVAALEFSSIDSFVINGFTRYGDEKVFRVEIKPQVAANFLGRFWQDFHYTIWVMKNKKYLAGFELNAKSKKNASDTVKMKVDFRDYNEKIAIEPPL